MKYVLKQIDAIRKLMFASMLMYKLDAAQLVPEK